VNGTVLSLTFRGMLGRRRSLLLFALPIVMIALSVVIRLIVGVDEDTAVPMLQRFALGTLLPLVALIAGTGVIAPEIDDGEIIYLLAKPVSRWSIVASKLVTAIALTMAFTTIPTLIAGAVLTGGVADPVPGFAAGTIVGAVAYCAVFVLLGVISRHAVVFGLLYALVWETLVGGYVPGARAVSVQDWAYSLTYSMSTDLGTKPEVGAAVALPLLAAVTVVALCVAVQRLRSLSLTGDS
jgi:ABC-2 type transport system permease protein